MKARRNHARPFIFLIVVFLLNACGGGGGDGGPPSIDDPIENCEWVAGTWLTDETENATDCGGGVDDISRTYEVAQNGCSINVTVQGKTFQGNVYDNTITWQGSFDEDDGITTANITLTIDGDSLGGTSNWVWTDGQDRCSGTTSITGTLLPSDDLDPPSTPTGLAATPVNGNQINLTWNASTDNVGVTGYKIYSGTGTLLGSVSGPFASLTGLSADSQYCIVVSAYDAADNESAASAQACATTLPGGSGADVDPPSTPTGLVATPVSTNQIDLSWSASTDNVGVTGYKIYASTGTLLASVSGPSASLTGFSADSQYCFVVSAYDAADNESATTGQACATTPPDGSGADVDPPNTPTGLSATPVSPTQIDLSWDPSTDNVGVAGYNIYRVSNLVPPWLIASAAGTSTSITGLTGAVEYCYRISAYDAAGNESLQSVSVCATTPPQLQVLTLDPEYDNAVYIWSNDSTPADTVYQNYMLPVGCNWSYDYVPYPADMWIQDYVCGRSLVNFDVSALSGKTIDHAILKLVTYQCGVGYNPRQWHIRALATSWSPSTVTWNIVETLQYYSSSEVIVFPPCYFGELETLEIDVTNIVQNWANGAWNNFGLLFGSEDYSFPYQTSFDGFEFYSLEDGGRDWPKLTVVYY